MREETTTAPALCMEEGDRILPRLDREIYYFLEIVPWLISLTITSFCKIGIIVLCQTVSCWWVVWRAENTVVPDKFRNQPSKHHNSVIHQHCVVWLDDRKDSRKKRHQR